MLGFDSEIVRLRDQAEISWEYEYRVLSRNGLLESTQLLEAGSGPGFITRKLAECLPRTRITALDTNSHMLDFAKLSIPEKLLDRIAFLNNSIYSFDIQPEQFDFILARLVFQHLEDPISAAKNALRLLRNYRCRRLSLGRLGAIYTRTHRDISESHAFAEVKRW
jgi:2-polyprenyl-3-methyl-5-hydroxy-6-metoxy-1,4-benzoquinol methylase